METLRCLCPNVLDLIPIKLRTIDTLPLFKIKIKHSELYLHTRTHTYAQMHMIMHTPHTHAHTGELAPAHIHTYIWLV